jgi:hypothetical protein
LSSKCSRYNLLNPFRPIGGVHFWSVIIFILLLSLFITLRLWNLTAYSLWGGEAFTMIGAQKNWSDMFAYIVADIVHPPLIYILLKLWIMVGGESLLWVKLLPVLSGLAVVVPFLLLCRELNFSLPEINLALLLLAINGYLIHYAQELRMYSLFMFLAMCSFWLFIRFFNSPGNGTKLLILLTIVNLLAIYTHYYGWLLVGMEFMFLLVWQRRRIVAFGLSMIFLLLCFAPWAYQVVQEARSIGGLESNLGWIPKPGLTNMLNLYVTFNGPLGNRYIKLFGLALFALPMLLWSWQFVNTRFKERKSDLVKSSWLALLAFFPVTVFFLVSQWMEQAVWMDRYFIFIAIPYVMLVATAVYRLNPVWLRIGWIASIVIWSLAAGFNDFRTNRMAWESPQLGSRIDWDGLVQDMISAEGDSSGPIKVYTLTVFSKGYWTGNWAISTSIDYFADLHGYDRFQTVYARDVYAVLEHEEEDHFWIGYFDLTHFPQSSPAKALNENGYQIGKTLVYQQQQERLVLLQVWRN